MSQMDGAGPYRENRWWRSGRFTGVAVGLMLVERLLATPDRWGRLNAPDIAGKLRSDDAIARRRLMLIEDEPAQLAASFYPAR
jgi:hypothetical protein